MLHVTATVSDEKATVVNVYDSRIAAEKARIRSGRAAVETLPVSMARPGSKQPKSGDTLATTTEASGLVAVAAVE